MQLIKARNFKAYSATLPVSIEKAIGQPPVCLVVKATSQESVQLAIEYELIILSRLVSAGGNLNEHSVPFIASQLILQYPNESLADFKLCFQRGASGVYGEIQRLDGVTIGVWMKGYLDEKYAVVERQLMEEKERPYEIAPNVVPEEKATDYLKDWLKQVEAIDIKKIKPMTERDIQRLGKEKLPPKSSSYQPNPEYAALRLLEIEWMKQMFHPITRERVENFLSFDEWVKR